MPQFKKSILAILFSSLLAGATAGALLGRLTAPAQVLVPKGHYSLVEDRP